MIRKLLCCLFLALIVVANLSAQSMTTVTGNIQGVTGIAATSGYVQFQLQPSSQSLAYRVSGIGVVAPQSSMCGINGSGQLQNLALTGSCQVWGNTVLAPANSTYTVTIAPNGTIANRLTGELISGTSYDLSQPVFAPIVTIQGAQQQTLSVPPLMSNLIPGANGVFTLGGPNSYYSSGYINNLFTNGISAQALNNRQMCDQFVGSDITDKINKCIAKVASAGAGIADASGFTNQTGSITIALSSPNILLLLPQAFTSTANPVFSATATNVHIQGGGKQGSLITAAGGNFFNFGVFSNLGDIEIDHLGVNGTGCTTCIAFYQPGDNTGTDTLYGISIHDTIATNFNVMMQTRNTANVWVYNNWWQDMNSGILEIGQNLNWVVTGNALIYGSGNGTGNSDGLKMDAFSFTGPTVVSPEGQRITGNQIFGFTGTCVNQNSSVGTFVNNNFCETSSSGIRFSSVNPTTEISDNYINLQTSSANAGIVGATQASPINSQVEIRDNTVVGSNGENAASCIQLNANTTHVNAIGNSCYGLHGIDFVGTSIGYVNVAYNSFNSTGNAASISINNGGLGSALPVYLDTNYRVGTTSLTSAQGGILTRDPWSSSARMMLSDTGGGTNGQLWDIDASSDIFAVRTRTDNDGTGNNAFFITRASGSTNISGFEIPSGTFYVAGGGTSRFDGRIQGFFGSNVASATDLTLGAGNVFGVTGTTTINDMTTTGWLSGAQVTLEFTGSLTLTNAGTPNAGTAAFKLQGSTNASVANGWWITFVYDGTNWNEISRKTP